MPIGRRSRGNDSLKRSAGTRALPPAILIVCEGNTEDRILTQLRQRWRIPNAQVEIAAPTGVPKTVVMRAKELWNKENKDPEVWVVFDRDEHPCWSRALDQARKLKFQLAHSNHCIELYGLLLHRDQTASIDRHKAQSDLKSLHSGYDHHKNPYFNEAIVCTNLDIAFQRAEHLINIATSEAVADPDRNPTTRFHLLIKRLSTLRRP